MVTAGKAFVVCVVASGYVIVGVDREVTPVTAPLPLIIIAI
jgi:hypothetical protein